MFRHFHHLLVSSFFKKNLGTLTLSPRLCPSKFWCVQNEMLAEKRIMLVPVWLLVSLLVHMQEPEQLYGFVLGFGDEGNFNKSSLMSSSFS
jgi:hypothetical protein